MSEVTFCNVIGGRINDGSRGMIKRYGSSNDVTRDFSFPSASNNEKDTDRERFVGDDIDDDESEGANG